MRDANEVALDQYQKELCESDKAQDWKDDYADELTSEVGEYYPFKAENIMEALSNLDSGSELFLTTAITVAAKLKDNPVSQEGCVIAIKKVIYDYWQAAATKKADRDYDTYYQEISCR